MSETNNNLVLIEFNGALVTITLNRPARHNSLVPSLLDALIGAIDKAESQREVRAIVLQASGSSFSTGGDLRAFLDNESRIEEYAAEIVGKLNVAITRLIESELPVIVAVDGQVTGGSLGLVLAADFVIITDRASFTPYYSLVGFSPDGGWTALLPNIIGRTRTSGTLSANLTISAQQAADWGIANDLVNSGMLPQIVAGICDRVLAGCDGAVRAGKRLMIPSDYAQRLEEERREFVRRVGSDEAMRGIRRFVERSRNDEE